MRNVFVSTMGTLLPELVLPGVSKADHPRLHAALFEMRHDFGGHRIKAIAVLDDATTQIDAALRSVGDNAKE